MYKYFFYYHQACTIIADYYNIIDRFVFFIVQKYMLYSNRLLYINKFCKLIYEIRWKNQ